MFRMYLDQVSPLKVADDNGNGQRHYQCPTAEEQPNILISCPIRSPDFRPDPDKKGSDPEPDSVETD